MGDPQQVPLGPDGSMSITFSPSRVFDEISFPSGGAGMAGTAGDFVRFLEAVRRGGAPVLRPESARAMMTNQIGALRVLFDPEPAWGFGFGGAVLVEPAIANTPQSAGTWKWGGVYGHQWFVDPVKNLTVVALTNTAFEGTMGRYTQDLLRAVYDCF
jgi:CubicO group peptidase (beta-lactamase class C family)